MTVEIKDKTAWTTDSEIRYLNQIGAFKPEHGKTKADFLKGYLRALPKRAKWIGMNKPLLFNHANKLLQQEIIGQSRALK